jgi:hypothetical protein
MHDQAGEQHEVKMYSDFKSPYAYLAFDPGMALAQRYAVRVRWIPFQLRLKGKGERSVYSEYKVKYSYLDARRWAKKRDIRLRGPLKIYDTTPALLGGLFAETQGRLLDYARAAFKQFFLRESALRATAGASATTLAHLARSRLASRSTLGLSVRSTRRACSSPWQAVRPVSHPLPGTRSCRVSQKPLGPTAPAGVPSSRCRLGPEKARSSARYQHRCSEGVARQPIVGAGR